MTRRTPLRSNPEKIRAWKQRTAKPLPKRGKKVKAWDAKRASLKVEFERSGITSCELGLNGCLGSNFLGFAHSLKRRNIKGEQLGEVILACSACHDIIERLPESEMAKIVREIINNR